MSIPRTSAVTSLVRVLLAAAAYFAVSHPASSDPQANIWTAGVYPCKAWLADSTTGSRKIEVRHWIYGFAAGIDFDTKGPKATFPDAAAADAFVDRYCEKNPHDAVAYAAAALVEASGGPKSIHRGKR